MTHDPEVLLEIVRKLTTPLVYWLKECTDVHSPYWYCQYCGGMMVFPYSHEVTLSDLAMFEHDSDCVVYQVGQLS